MSRSEAPPIRFVADCMLGRLAKWLKILGFDCRYDRAAEDSEIVRMAEAEDLVILTRDTRLVERRAARRYLIVTSDDPDEQVRQVVEAFGLPIDPARFLSRCLPCNAALVPLPHTEAAARVPPFVASTQRSFARCPSCGQIYWGATHRADIVDRLERIFGRGVLASDVPKEPPSE